MTLKSILTPAPLEAIKMKVTTQREVWKGSQGQQDTNQRKRAKQAKLRRYLKP
jgi:hypothetical protein